MIVLDAGVLIALFDGHDAHHSRAEQIFATHADDDLTVNPITQAEVLVRATREGRQQQMLTDMGDLGITVTPFPVDAGPSLARIRADTGLKMPDCCVLLTAHLTDGSVATFDQRLARVGGKHGVRALP